MASGVDRISDLPEGVLHHILSLVPAHDAVRTSAVGPQWRRLWRSAPGLGIVGADGWAGGIPAFVSFVDALLRARRGGAALQSVDFDLHLPMPMDDPDWPEVAAAMEAKASGWIRRALRRHVQELRLRVRITPISHFVLQDRRLASQHLTRLELAGVLCSAQVLDFSACPALKHLRIERCHVCSTKLQSPPSLKHLSIESCNLFTNIRTVMSFPNLVSFEFVSNTGRAPLLGSMPSLETATVRFDHSHADKCKDGGLVDCGDAACEGCSYYYGPNGSGCVFLQGLTQATNLDLSAYPDMYVFIRDMKWCPTFSNLKTLVLDKWFVPAELKALIWFLHHAPLLEKLTLKIQEVDNFSITIEESCTPLEQSAAASNLQIVKIICNDVDGIVLKILKVLNTNGVPQEKIRIQYSGQYTFVGTDTNSE